MEGEVRLNLVVILVLVLVLALNSWTRMGSLVVDV